MPTPVEVVHYVEVDVGARVQIPLNQAENQMEVDETIMWTIQIKNVEKELSIEIGSGKKGIGFILLI